MTDRHAQSTYPGYQEILRAVGAWLDVRGYRDVRIIESRDGFTVQGRPAGDDPTTPFETLRLDRDGMRRLCDAAFRDRGAFPPPSTAAARPSLSLIRLGSDNPGSSEPR